MTGNGISLGAGRRLKYHKAGGTFGSRHPERITRLVLSCMTTASSEKVTVNPASQIGPIPMSVCWNPGMTCPVRGKALGRSGIWC